MSAVKMEATLRPGVRLGSYPQRPESGLSEFEQLAERWLRRLSRTWARRSVSQKYVLGQVQVHGESLKTCSEQVLDEAIADLRARLGRDGLTRELIFHAFAVIRECAFRTLGKRHYDVQVFGGWLMINGKLAEMETGEGKTLTTTLPACSAALAGVPVHVVTANDYLAARDCELMRPLYHRLGLTAAAVVDGMQTQQRQLGYACDIVHTTHQQVAFDYLRDRIEMGQDTGRLKFQFRDIQRHRPGGPAPLLLRGLCLALVDEADNVLIDDARTPLIITRPVPDAEPPEAYSDALYLASMLFPDQDYLLDQKARRVELTGDGEDRLAEIVLNLPERWRQRRRREHLVTQALVARHFYHKDKHYLVRDSKVQIIDESTGRLMPDRSWEQGLHQLIEAKEGCVISEQREPLARISYQRFFSRYLRLGGASGTLGEVAAELQQVYALDVVKVPTCKPSQRRLLAERVYRDQAAQKKAFVARMTELNRQQRPVLIGTGSVSESELVSKWLQEIGLAHQVLNAKQDLEEAEIIAAAGRKAAITVATNMAGRGTDIGLEEGVAESGGLHVLALSLNASRRIDRQLYGRCARQGDPGSAEAIFSLQDPTLTGYFSSSILAWLRSLAPGTRSMPGWLSRWVLRLPQRASEREQRRVRRQLLKQDRRMRRILAFSGKFE